MGSREKEVLTTVDVAKGRDEMNLAEFPLFYLGRHVPRGLKTIEFESEVRDKASGAVIPRKVSITGTDKFGLPTVRDADVLLAILLLGKKQHNFEKDTVSFSRYQLAEILQWDHSGTTYRRIKLALQKWVGTVFDYDHAWWNKGDRQWQSATINLVSAVHFNEVSGNKKKQMALPLSQITFSPLLFNSLRDGNLKAINLDEYFELSSPVAKQAYRFLDKRFYHSGSFEGDLKTFACEHIGISRSYAPSRIKDKLRPALEELEAIGFITSANVNERFEKVGHGKYKILLHKAVSDQDGLADSSLFGELTSRGVNAKVARQLLADKNIPEYRIGEKIELFDWIKSQNPKSFTRNAGGFLAEAIRNDYALPAGFETAAQRQERETAQRKHAKATQQKQLAFEQDQERQREVDEQARREKQAAITSYLSRLSSKEQQRIEEEAINSGSQFTRDLYRKACKKQNEQAAAIYRELLITSHVEELLDQDLVTA